jgi:hypothetical protein
MMENGKKIGAVIVVAAIGLIAYWLLNSTENGTTVVDGEVATNAVSPAVQAVINTALPVDDDSQVYAINVAESEVYWRVYRAGALARLGHNHVISMSQLDGSLTLGSDPANSVWELSFPVDSLIIDEPELRARYGEDFESVPSEDDKAGTKVNMLTDRVLDGVNFPEIRLEGSGFGGSLDDASLPVSIQILGRTIEQTFAASISISADSVTVTGEHRLTHADLGMEPFSLLGGAMAVGAEIDITYRLQADAVGP